MAESLAHRWGQIIGDGFEMFVRNILGEVAQRHGLYLDFKRPRATRGGQGKVTWQDGYGNKHDLDYVLERGGKKTYNNMIACYFLDMAQTWKALRRVCAAPSEVCFVIGDSAPYGVYVPVIEWFGKLALAAGFESWSFEKLRDRNIKWKNRKHRVPLCEGHLWVRG